LLCLFNTITFYFQCASDRDVVFHGQDLNARKRKICSHYKVRLANE